MSMVHTLRDLMVRLLEHRARVSGTLMMMLLAGLSHADVLRAQAPAVHYHHAGVMSPGAIGRRQLSRGGPLRGYVQPVEIRAPAGARVSLAIDGALEEPQATPRTVGMFVSPVYRLKVTRIPLNAGAEVFPTIEIIDRLYPPLGQERKFPIPIELAREDLELALEGKFVTRVIYLENPLAALPHRQPKQQDFLPITAGENPLEVADRLGRPVAILRMGGRLPSSTGPDAAFLYGSPSWIQYAGKKQAGNALRHRVAVPAAAKRVFALSESHAVIPFSRRRYADEIETGGQRTVVTRRRAGGG